MFSVHSTEGEARCGVLNTPNGAVNTPAMLVYTHRGGAVNLTVDLLEKLKPQLQALQLYRCDLNAVPSALSRRSRLTLLDLSSNPLKNGGWGRLAPLTVLVELKRP